MIETKKDMQEYIMADMKSLQCYPITLKMRVGSLFCPTIWKFQVMLRKLEYEKNKLIKNPSIFRRISFWLNEKRFRKYGTQLGFSIPLNVFGPGLCLCHVGTIIVNEACKIGANCRIHACVNIGNFSKFGDDWTADNAPVLGNNVYIGPGAKIYGAIKIGDNVAIGANAVVNKDVPNNVTVAGVPARIINNEGSNSMIIKGYKEI